MKTSSIHGGVSESRKITHCIGFSDGSPSAVRDVENAYNQFQQLASKKSFIFIDLRLECYVYRMGFLS